MCSISPLRLVPGRSAKAAALLFLVGFALTARAETTPPSPPPTTAPEVSDPMLAPPPAAPRIVSSWNDALSLLRAHSPDYVTSLEGVRRAEAQSRIALAAVLPTLNGQVSYTHQFLTKNTSSGSERPSTGRS